MLGTALNSEVDSKIQATGRRRPAGRQQPLVWGNVLVLATVHLFAVVAILYMVLVHFSWATLGLGIAWYTLCGMSITAGYHRLFAHQSYRAAAWLRGVFLTFGSGALQNHAYAWSMDHRRHHKVTDEPNDPYSVRDGFWWAHMGWVFRERTTQDANGSVRDLESDRLVQLQRRFYLPLAIFIGFIAPMLIALLWGDPLGGLLVAGFLRVFAQMHATFTVNSLAHMIGTRPYCRDSSARNTIFVALVSFGEGYHNYHHRFQTDYRNGVRWFHFDPTKWFVAMMSWFGATRALRRAPAEVIRRAVAESRLKRIAARRSAGVIA